MAIKRLALVSSLLALAHGLYFPLYFLWLVLAPIGISELSNLPLFFPVLDTVLYLLLGAGMLRGKKGYFIYSIVWSVWSALLTTLVASYGNASYALNLLSFLLVFCSTYYYVDTNNADPAVSKAVGTIAGVLALAQGIIVAVVVAAPFVGLTEAIDINQTSSGSILLLVLTTGAIYLVLGIGMVLKKSIFFKLAIFWTVVEAALAIAFLPIVLTHLNIISILITTFATYSYFGRKALVS